MRMTLRLSTMGLLFLFAGCGESEVAGPAPATSFVSHQRISYSDHPVRLHNENTEMIRLGLSRKRAREIGHLPQSGPAGMLEWLGQLPGATRKILIHINNTNPILDETSPERAELRRRGVEVAWDGMEIVL